MPRGRPKKFTKEKIKEIVKELKEAAPIVEQPKPEVIQDVKKEEKKEIPVLSPVKEALEPLQPGQKYFEAPTGEIVIGEADKQQIFFRKLNNGKGGWINPKR
jgi:hypothetical protein